MIELIFPFVAKHSGEMYRSVEKVERQPDFYLIYNKTI